MLCVSGLLIDGMASAALVMFAPLILNPVSNRVLVGPRDARAALVDLRAASGTPVRRAWSYCLAN